MITFGFDADNDAVTVKITLQDMDIVDAPIVEAIMQRPEFKEKAFGKFRELIDDWDAEDGWPNATFLAECLADHWSMYFVNKHTAGYDIPERVFELAAEFLDQWEAKHEWERQ